MEFQCISWYASDVESDLDEELMQYKIYIFGRTKEGKSICVNTKFNPYFFVECPQTWTTGDLQYFKRYIIEKLRYAGEKDHETYTLESADFVTRKKFYGFTNNENFKFIRLIFTSKKAFTKCTYILSPKSFVKWKEPALNISGIGAIKPMTLYESNIDPMLRFCHIQDIKPAGWANLKNFKFTKVNKISSCDIEIEINSWKDIIGSNREDIAPFVQASFDIETYSYDGSFPDPTDDRCPCIQIATTFQRFGENESYKKHLLNLGTIDDIDGVDVIACETEKELLEKWSEIIVKEDVDVLIGYNIWGFDLHYMYTRAEKKEAFNFFQLGRFLDTNSLCKEASFSSGAYGDSDYLMVDTLGRFQIDLLVVMKREHKLSSYSLNNVAEHFLKDKKVDMPYKEMFKKYKGTSADRKEIGIYCIHDTNLPLKLVNKLAILPNMIEMAKATWVPPSFLIERGQGIKVFSQILQMTRQHNMLVVTLKKTNNTETQAYEGATVLGAKSGAYMDTPITGLDFASLYPTIMRAHNLCHSTLIMDSKYDNIENIEYKEIDGYKFVQNVEGILPKMLKTLATNRKQAKKDMTQASKNNDSFMKSVYNGKQLAFKVSMNSIYGFTGAMIGMLPCKPVASCTTSIGRQMIDQTKELVELWYPGAEVVYGDTDSVMVKFDTGNLKGKEALEKCFKLGEEAAEKISETFKKPIELEFEKVYFPYLLFSKKRYAGLMYTNPKKPDYIDAKGIQIVRRDNCKYVRDVSKNVLDTIMYDLDIKSAIDIAKKAATDLLKNKIIINDLVVSKSLRRINYWKTRIDIPKNAKYIKCNGFYLTHEYSNANLPHITVAIKREEREPGTGPKSGDRVPYVFIDTGNKKDLQYLKAEDPEYAVKHKCQPDLQYYMEHGLRSPLESLFSVFIDKPYEVLFKDIVQQRSIEKNMQVDLYEFLDLSNI
uniref:DNA-directed DNA polymerase n=1 Tax=viral metagenome TaxID=1070528 RepID=A0A6C0FBH7_9ZZZZ